MIKNFCAASCFRGATAETRGGVDDYLFAFIKPAMLCDQALNVFCQEYMKLVNDNDRTFCRCLTGTLPPGGHSVGRKDR